MEYSLLTFGIHCSEILSSGDGKTDLHDDYIQRRNEIEFEIDQRIKLEEEKTGIVEYPTSNDVLIGRGKPYHEYVGTRKLIQIIDSKMAEYYKYDLMKASKANADDRFWKTCINTDIVAKITEAGGRFLQRIPNKGWKILNQSMAREKTANLFRYRHNAKTTTGKTQPRATSVVIPPTLGNINHNHIDMGINQDAIAAVSQTLMFGQQQRVPPKRTRETEEKDFVDYEDANDFASLFGTALA